MASESEEAGSFNYEKFEDAAVQAEYETGEHEGSDAEARAHIAVRVARMTLGFLVLILGIIMLPAPGPGGIVVAAGLAILAKDVAWADRALRWMRKRTPGIPEDGKIPTSTIIISVMMMVAAFLVFTYVRNNYDLPIIG